MAGRPRRRQVQPGGPANGVRSPFEPGNLAALRSGAYSPRVRDEYAAALTDWAREQGALGFLVDESFAPSVWRWATRTAAADLLYDQLARHHSSRRRPCPGWAVCRSLEERWQKLDRSAERAGERLGLDPQSRAELLVKLRAAGLVESEFDTATSLLGQLAAALGLPDFVDDGGVGEVETDE